MNRIFTVVTLLATSAVAGQLVIDEHGLKELVEHRQELFAATVKVVRASELELEVTQIFVAPDEDELQPGQTVKRALYGGVEWTDPHESPIEQRLRGALREAPVGTKVIVAAARGAGVELLADTPAVRRKLSLLLAPGEVAKQTPAALKQDLTDADLAELARAELARRGLLTPLMLLDGDELFVRDYFTELSAEKKAAFLRAALPAAKAGGERRERLLGLVFNDAGDGALASLPPYVALLSAKREADRPWLDSLHATLLEAAGKTPAPDFTPFADVIVTLCLSPPGYGSPEEKYAQLTRPLPPAAKARVAVGLLKGAVADAKAPDTFCLGEAARLVEEAPSPPVIDGISKLNPLKAESTHAQEDMMNAMLRIAVAVVKAHPKEKARARFVIEQWLTKDVPASPEALAAWIAAGR